ncbi:S9 family peptidase [Caulobacter sp. 17J65-9]|uniref:alpha/beta hydrolase family protein n=1 Tax=Caulobacter sp. 17J65-9 TaxID=2709382 RepID=UPI0013CC3CF0|nr:S9 family peptidase [Caulobacter sp. 17J65-9]NEX94061.1 S9 family peptidase [Caulobacter sp. 17J65-9]
MFGRTFATAAAAAVLQFACAAPALAAPPPIEAYGQLPGLDKVAISPGGQNIAYIAQVGDKRRLGVQTVAGQPLGVVDLGTVKIRSISWLDDTHVVIVQSVTTDKFSDFGDLLEASNGQIYNVTTRKFATVLDSASGVGSSRTGDESVLNLFNSYWVREIDGQRVMLVDAFQTGNSTLFKIDPDTGKGTPFLKNFDGLLDAAGKVTAKSERRFELGSWRLLADDGVKDRELFVWKGGEKTVDWPSLMGFGRAPDTVLVAIPESGERDTLYEFSLKDGAKKKLGIPAAGDISPVYHRETGRLLGFHAGGEERDEYLFTDPTLAEAWASIEAGFPGKLVSPQGWTPDFSKILVKTEGKDDSGTYLLIDRAARKAMKVGSAYPGVPAEAVNEVKWIKYKAQDGTEIPAYLTLPRGRDPKSLPLIVLPHGGPAARDVAGFDWWSQAIASRGYAVLQPQFRGSDGFGRAFLEAGYGKWGKEMQTDLSDGVRYLAAEGVVDPKRVCIMGWSYGGYAAMAGPTLDPGVYRCAVAGAGVADIRKMLLWVKGFGAKDSEGTRYWKRNMGAAKVDDRGLDAVSPALHVDQVNVPILLLHGTDDTVVPIEQTQLMADALKKAGKPYEFVKLQGEDHWISKGATRTQMLQTAIAFIEKNNPPN